MLDYGIQWTYSSFERRMNFILPDETLMPEDPLALKHPEYYGFMQDDDHFHVNTFEEIGWHDPVPQLLQARKKHNKDLVSRSVVDEDGNAKPPIFD